MRASLFGCAFVTPPRLRGLVLSSVMAIASAAACSDRPGDARLLTAVGDGSDTTPFERIGSWYFSGFDQPARLVIRNEAAWGAFWAQLEEGQSPKTEPPAVDFERDMVIAVAMGTSNSGGYQIQIEQILESDGRRAVDVNEISPGGGCVVPAVLSQPVDAVRVPAARDTQIRFFTRHTARNCD